MGGEGSISILSSKKGPRPSVSPSGGLPPHFMGRTFPILPACGEGDRPRSGWWRGNQPAFFPGFSSTLPLNAHKSTTGQRQHSGVRALQI